MISSNLPDLLSFSRMSRNVAQIKTRSDIARNEVVTGKIEDVTRAVNGDIGGVHQLKKNLDDIQSYQTALSLAQTRAETTQLSLSRINEESAGLSAETLAAIGRNDQTALSTLSNDARAKLAGVFASLNASVGGRALFSGNETTTSPLAPSDQLLADIENIFANSLSPSDAKAQLDFYFNDPAGGFATSIYQGGTGDAPFVEVAPGLRLGVYAKAIDKPVRDIIRGFASIAASPAAGFPGAETLVSDETTDLATATNNLTDLRGTIGANEAQIANFQAQYEAEETVLSRLYNDKTARDPFEAASQLQLLESQLEASFVLTSRLSQLTLSNYLR